MITLNIFAVIHWFIVEGYVITVTIVTTETWAFELRECLEYVFLGNNASSLSA